MVFKKNVSKTFFVRGQAEVTALGITNVCARPVPDYSNSIYLYDFLCDTVHLLFQNTTLPSFLSFVPFKGVFAGRDPKALPGSDFSAVPNWPVKATATSLGQLSGVAIGS